MLDVIEKLLVLQDRDRNIRRVSGELTHIEPERQMFKTRAVSSQAAVDAIKTKIKQIETERKGLELEVEGKKQMILRYSNQQLETRKNEEYRALAHEIETCKEQIFGIENREIELMEQAEAAQADLARATQDLNAARKRLDEQLVQLAAREANLNKELASLQTNRDELAAAVDDGARARYDRLTRSKGENVVVGVQHGVCGGCHMRLPAQVLVSCQAQKEPVICTNCGRILYFTRDMDLALVD